MNLKTQSFSMFLFFASHTHTNACEPCALLCVSVCVYVRVCVGEFGCLCVVELVGCVCVCVCGCAGGGGGVGGTGVNLLWRDVALLPHESD